MKRMALAVLLLAGCDDGARSLSQVGVVSTEMIKVEFAVNESRVIAYCGGSSSEAAYSYYDARKLAGGSSLVDELSPQSSLKKGVYLFSKFGNEFVATVSPPFDEFPAEKLMVDVFGKRSGAHGSYFIELAVDIGQYKDLANSLTQDSSFASVFKQCEEARWD